MANLGTLTLDLIAKVGGFTRPLDKAERHHKKTAQQIAYQQKKMRAEFKKSMVSMGKLGAAMAVAAAVGAVAMTKASFAAADLIGKTADTAGVTTDALQEMRFAAEISGMSIQELDKSIMGFGKRVGELRANTGGLYTILKATNHVLLAQVKAAPSVDSALDMIMKAMSETADDADRAALAVAAFGRSGQAMSILSKNYNELRQEARELGLVIDEDLIRNAEKTNDQMTVLAAIIKTQVTAALLELAPYIQDIVSDTTDWIKNNKEFLSQDLPGYVRDIGDAVKDFVDSPYFEAFKEYWEIIAGALIGFAAGGPLGALLGAAGGAGLSIYSDLSEYFETTLPEQIRDTKKEIADLEKALPRAPMYGNIFTMGRTDIKERVKELKGELKEYEDIAASQRIIREQAEFLKNQEKEKNEALKKQAAILDDLTASMKDLSGIPLNFEISDTQQRIEQRETFLGTSEDSEKKKVIAIELAALRDYLRQLEVIQELEVQEREAHWKTLTVQRNKEAKAKADHVAKILALDLQVQDQLELIGLEGYQKELTALKQKQTAELEQYRKAGADILALERLHAEQRKALKKSATAELMSSFTDAPGFAGTGGAFGELGMLEQQREDLAKWYAEQLALLETYRQERADLNEKWNEQERKIEEQHSEQLARIEQSRTQLILASNASMFGSLADIQKTFSDEQNATYKTLFAISKGFTVAETTLNMYNAISDAWATGATVADKVAAASMVAAGMLTIVQSAQAVGMAHGGIDSVLETGTWLLQKGERVVDERTSKKLDKTLSQVQSGNWNVNIHEAPGTTAQVIQRSDGLDVQIALIEEKMIERMSRGSGMAGALDSRYGRRG